MYRLREEDYRLLEFDHKSNKDFNIAGTQGKSLEKYKKEIDKCDLRCVKCHHIKTINTLYKKSNYNYNNKHLQTFWYKEEYSIYEIIKYFGLCVNRVLKTYLINTRKKEGCCKCGCKKYINDYPGVYHLNHLVDSKVSDISMMRKICNYNVLDIYCELLKCEVLCGNCHKLFTLNTRYRDSIMYEIKNKDDFIKLKSPDYYNNKTYKEPHLIKSRDKICVYFSSEVAIKIYNECPSKRFEKNEEDKAIKFRDEVQNNIDNIDNIDSINIEEIRRKYNEDKKLSHPHYIAWLKNYNNFIIFKKKNKKNPYTKSVDNGEKSLVNWFTNQTKRYNNNKGVILS